MTKALYVGSFDPVTLGHMDIIKRAAAMFDEVEIAVGDNPNKKYMFSFAERVKLMEKAIHLLPTETVLKLSLEYEPIMSLTADYARRYGFDVIIKGVRTTQDFDYEKMLHEISATQQRGIETVLLFSSEHLGYVSSSAAKELAKYQGLIHKYVPIHVKAAIEAKLGQRIIGVTGTVGSGKSTFCERYAANHGATHVNMDLLAHELLTSELPLAVETREKVKREFGTINRKELGEIVFGNEAELKKLNEIYKEPMLTMLREKLAGLKGTILLEGALLAEMDWLFLCNNRIVLAKTPSLAEHHRRLLGRGMTLEQIDRRVKSQYFESDKVFTIAMQLNKDIFGKCLMYDSENTDWDDATAKIREYIKSEE